MQLDQLRSVLTATSQLTLAKFNEQNWNNEAVLESAKSFSNSTLDLSESDCSANCGQFSPQLLNSLRPSSTNKTGTTKRCWRVQSLSPTQPCIFLRATAPPIAVSLHCKFTAHSSRVVRKTLQQQGVAQLTLSTSRRKFLDFVELVL